MLVHFCSNLSKLVYPYLNLIEIKNPMNLLVMELVWNCSNLAEGCPNLSEIVQTCLKSSKLVWNCLKLFKFGWRVSKLVWNCSNFSKLVYTYLNFSKFVQTCLKLFKLVKIFFVFNVKHDSDQHDLKPKTATVLV